MTQSSRSLALLFSLLATATVAAQTPKEPPVKSGDIERYRKHFLPANEAEPKNGAVKVTFLGTGTLLFDDGETQLMTDGFFSRPSLLKVIRGKIETDPKVVDAALKRRESRTSRHSSSRTRTTTMHSTWPTSSRRPARSCTARSRPSTSAAAET